MRLPILFFTAVTLLAQNKAPDKAADKTPEVMPLVPSGSNEAVIIPVKNLVGDSFQRLLNLLSVFNARYKGDADLGTIVVYAPHDVVTQMKRVIEELDKPGSVANLGHNIEMTLTFLRCSPSGASGSEALPTEMQSVVKQLRATVPCALAQVWDTVPMRLQEGKEASGNLQLPQPNPNMKKASVVIRMRPDAVFRREQARYVRFSRVDLTFRSTEADGRISDFSVNTAGDFMESQRTVLGKVSGLNGEDSIYSVIALKVLD
jgi:hypothetical protein